MGSFTRKLPGFPNCRLVGLNFLIYLHLSICRAGSSFWFSKVAKKIRLMRGPQIFPNDCVCTKHSLPAHESAKPLSKGPGKRGGKSNMGIQQWNGVFLAFSLAPCVLSLLRFLFGNFFFIPAYHIQSTSLFSALSLFVPDPLSIKFPLHPYLVFFLQYVHSLTLMPARLFLIPVHPPNKTHGWLFAGSDRTFSDPAHVLEKLILGATL